MQIIHFFDQETSTLTYVVFDEKTLDAVIIDPVLNYDPSSGKITDTSSTEVVNFVRTKELKVHAVLETHAHADHISSSNLLKQVYPGIKVGIGENIKTVQKTFKEYFHLEEIRTDGSQFDLLLKDHEEVQFGGLKMVAIPTPGHTPACMSFLFEGNLFVGDALFMPDSGTGRCDFPKGSARDLYRSVSKNIYSLPDETRIYVGHDYQPNGRTLQYETTVGESKKGNIQLKGTTTEEEYVKMRESRDATLKAPKLLLPSIQVNINAGAFPHKENGGPILKLPVKNGLTLGEL